MIMQMPNLPDPTQGGRTSDNQNAINNLNNQPSGDSISASSGQNQSPLPSSNSGGLHKEQEPLSIGESVVMKESVADVEVSPELERAGVVKRSETIDLPPDVKAMGVSAAGPAQPVIYTGAVQLPLTDDQIIVGLHAQILSSLRWLAEWCVRQLKKVHTHLKTVGGKVVREEEN